MHVKPAGCCVDTVVTILSCPDPKSVESYLCDTVMFSESTKTDDQICYLCYKFFNRLLKSGACMLSSEDIITELMAKKQNLERIVHEF